MSLFNQTHCATKVPDQYHSPLRPTEFNNSLPELLCSDDDSGNEDVLDMEYTEAEAENLKRNAEVLNIMLPHNVCLDI